jgi:hypothetical protein
VEGAMGVGSDMELRLVEKDPIAFAVGCLRCRQNSRSEGRDKRPIVVVCPLGQLL